jgi:hypothetical protein
MKAITLAAALLAVAITLPVAAQQSGQLGEHPAVIVKRMYEQQGYDYASKFYPHPAWLYLAGEAPRPMIDHPAVIVARRERERLEAAAAARPAAKAAHVAPVTGGS